MSGQLPCHCLRDAACIFFQIARVCQHVAAIDQGKRAEGIERTPQIEVVPVVKRAEPSRLLANGTRRLARPIVNLPDAIGNTERRADDGETRIRDSFRAQFRRPHETDEGSGCRARIVKKRLHQFPHKAILILRASSRTHLP